MNEYMKEALNSLNEGVNKHDGGPFGACIADKNGYIIATGHNEVLKTNDPTMHAEVNVIRKACSILKSHDLSECTLYTTCYPCPMCMSAIMWAGIKKVFYACNMHDANETGFSDEFMYNAIKTNIYPLDLIEEESNECKEAMKNYKGDLY